MKKIALISILLFLAIIAKAQPLKSVTYWHFCVSVGTTTEGGYNPSLDNSLRPCPCLGTTTAVSKSPAKKVSSISPAVKKRTVSQAVPKKINGTAPNIVDPSTESASYGLEKKNNGFTASLNSSGEHVPQTMGLHEMPLDGRDASDPFTYKSDLNDQFKPADKEIKTESTGFVADKSLESSGKAISIASTSSVFKYSREDSIRDIAESMRSKGRIKVGAGIGLQAIAALVFLTNTQIDIKNHVSTSSCCCCGKTNIDTSVKTNRNNIVTIVAGGLALAGVALEISGAHNIRKSKLYLRANGLYWRF